MPKSIVTTGTAQQVSGPSHGTLTFHADGSFAYTPKTHYVGPDSFTFTWSDGLTAGNTADRLGMSGSVRNLDPLIVSFMQCCPSPVLSPVPKH